MGVLGRHQAWRYPVPAEPPVDADDENVFPGGEFTGAGQRKREVTAFVTAERLAVEPHLGGAADRPEPDFRLLVFPEC